MPFAKRDGVRLFWRQEGHPDRPALLLLNSLGSDHAMWDGVASRLTERYCVLRMDTRGHGASDAPPGGYTIATLAADALAVLDAAGVKSAHVCGLSLGGFTALRMAVDTPDRVKKIVICNSSAAVAPEGWQQRAAAIRSGGMASMVEAIMTRWFSPAVLAANPVYLDTLRATFLGLDAEGYASCCDAIAKHSMLGELAHITAPMLVVNGSLDTATPPGEHGERLAAGVAGAKMASLPTGHISAVEEPAQLAALIMDFIDGTEAALTPGRDAMFDHGIAVRRAVLGDAWVDAALKKRGGFAGPFQEYITRIAWGEIWGRPGLDHRTRRVIVLATTIALGRWEEFTLHTRAALEQGGLTQDELREVLMQSSVYAGVPAANTAFHHAEAVIAGLPKTGG